MVAADKEKLKELVERVGSVNAAVRKWHSARKIDIRKDNFIQDYKLDSKDPLYQGFTLRGLKNVIWAGKPAELYYAFLCEATHPNVGATGLYVDETSVASGRGFHLVRKERRSLEVYSYVFDLVCRPTMECVAIIDRIIGELRQGKSDIENFSRKIRQVT